MTGGEASPERDRRQRLRILRYLSSGAATIERAATPALLLLNGSDRATISVESSILELLLSDGLVARIDDRVELTSLGSSSAKEDLPDDTRYRDQHMDLDFATFRTNDGYVSLLVNRAESPLAQLARRKTRNGKPFLTEKEFLAGERLRADYTRGQMMPRMSANWEAPVSSGGRGGGDRYGDLTDAALGARIRVDNALEAIGPELAGPLVDVCCFLKGIEQVEAERGWPARSAKLILKTALAALCRHYEPRETRRAKANILHWGAPDFRPSLTGN